MSLLFYNFNFLMKISTSYMLSYVLYFHKYISCNYFNVFAYNSNIYRICYFAVVFLLIVSEHVLCKLSIFLIESQALWFWKWRWKSSRWYYFHQRSSAFSLLGRQSRGKKVAGHLYLGFCSESVKPFSPQQWDYTDHLLYCSEVFRLYI